jgi:hypothetical protein
MLTAVEGPRAGIAVVSCVASGPGQWQTTWLIANEDDQPLRLEEAWVPHGRFRGNGHVTLVTDIPVGESRRLALDVMAAEPPRTVVENAFLILRLTRANQSWRVFARMRIEFDAQSEPLPIVESITAQSIQ